MIDRNNYKSVEVVERRIMSVEPDKKQVFSVCVSLTQDTRREVINHANSTLIPENKVVRVLSIQNDTLFSSYWIILKRKSGRDAYRVF